jgi:hypothetical protein
MEGIFNRVGRKFCLGVSTIKRVAEEMWGESELRNFVIMPNLVLITTVKRL